jgi:Protein of unknown function (DUF2800)
MMRAVSASAISRLMTCPASAVLPGVDESSPAADEGTAKHAYLANAIPHGEAVAYRDVAVEYRDGCAEIDVDAIRRLIGKSKPHCEIAYEYHPETETACILGENIGREYPVKVGCVYGTADLVLTNGRVAVYDYKTGQRVEPAAVNRQLRTLAVMASRVYNVDEVDVGIVYVWGKEIVLDLATLSSFDLDATAADLVRVVQRVEAARAKLSIGQVPDVYPSDDACKWCPAKKACPARGALIRAAMAGEVEIPKLEIKELSNEALADAYKAVVRRYKPIIEAFEEEIREEILARGEVLDLGDGTALGIKAGNESIDSDVAFSIIEAELGTEVAQKACKLSVTKDGLKKAIKGDVDRILQLIRDGGGMKIGAPSVREIKLKI